MGLLVAMIMWVQLSVVSNGDSVHINLPMGGKEDLVQLVNKMDADSTKSSYKQIATSLKNASVGDTLFVMDIPEDSTIVTFKLVDSKDVIVSNSRGFFKWLRIKVSSADDNVNIKIPLFLANLFGAFDDFVLDDDNISDWQKDAFTMMMKNLNSIKGKFRFISVNDDYDHVEIWIE